MTLTLNKN